MSRYYKTKIELTEGQLRYLSTALFEYGYNSDIIEKEYMFKKLNEILREGNDSIQATKKFYAEKNYYKAYKKSRSQYEKI